MSWQVKIEKEAYKEISKLDFSIQDRIYSYLEDVAKLDNPRQRGKAMIGNKSGLWRYRVGDYRVICDIQDKVLTILVLEAGHRSNVYR